MNILICTIIRNSANTINRYIQQIHTSMDLLANNNINWYISIYENDSVDGTKQLLQQLNLSRFTDYSIISENIKTTQYPSVVNEDRVRNLSIARNNALTAKNMYLNADYVLWIEPDVLYGADFIPILLYHTELITGGIDIISGINIVSQEARAYDTWATRRTPFEEWGNRTNDWFINPISQFYSTFNGVCLYNAKPFKEGVRFGYYNERLGKFDCDTVVVCENFRKAGYNKIYINQALNCYHD